MVLRITSKMRCLKLIALYFTIYCLLFTNHCFATDETTITSETLEYSEDASTYIAKGSARLESIDKVIESDEMSYNAQTSEVVAIGNVRYDDPDMWFTASKAELDVENETGKLYNAEILFKEDNYHVAGKEIEKMDEKHYFAPEATFSTCDAPIPAWCFRGKNVDLLVDEKLKAKDAFFLIKNTRVLYSPYISVPFQTERKTGFLMPFFDNSNTRGIHLGIPFFWAISENMDATATMDIFSKRGIGEGLEFRYVEPGNIKGNLWLYHIWDTEFNKDYLEIKALHDERSEKGIGGFLSVNYVNRKDFYREFNPYFEKITLRFLDSTGEISLPFENSRIYFLSQYWVDLKEGTNPPSQRLPELGYVLNPTKAGPFWFSATATASNFWRDEGITGQRFDIYPRVLYELGSDIILSQALGFRETAYSLHRSEDDFLHREAIEYNALIHTSFLKRYGSFMHVLEPSIGYTLITDSEKLPVFDSTELFKKTSTIELSIINRFLDSSREFIIIRASQAFDADLGDRPFLPFKLEVGLKKPISLRADATYDVHEGKLNSVDSNIGFGIPKGTIWAGQRYNRLEDVVSYTTGFMFTPYNPWTVSGRVWYNAKEKEFKDVAVALKYMGQCWGVKTEFIKRPHDFTFSVMFELKGISKAKI